MWSGLFVFAHEPSESASSQSKGISIANPFIFISFIHFAIEVFKETKMKTKFIAKTRAANDVRMEHMAPIAILALSAIPFRFNFVRFICVFSHLWWRCNC